jgi:hypothetical protein
MLLPLLSAIGLCMHHSTVQAFRSGPSGLCCYTALIAHPSTGKSPASTCIKTALEKIETYGNVQRNNSQLTNPATVECLFHILDRIPCLLGKCKIFNIYYGSLRILNFFLAMYDESATWLGSLGRYTSGSQAAPYERSIYLTLWAAVNAMDRDTKTARQRLVKPRYHTSLNGHPIQFINLLRNERFSYDDGLFQRFFTAAPEPPNLLTKDIRNAPESMVKLHCLLYFIHLNHFDKKRNYTFSKEAAEIFDKYFDTCKLRVNILNQFDPFLGAMMGKNATQLSRLCMMIQALTYACEVLVGQIDANSEDLTNDFVTAATILANNAPNEAFVINEDIMQRCVKLNNYFNMHKMVLSGYAVDPTGTYEAAIEKILSGKKSKLSLPEYLIDIPKKVLSLMKKAFQIVCTHLTAGKLDRNNTSVQEANEVFVKLEELGLGKQELYTGNNNIACNSFVRITSEQLRQSQEHCQIIVDLGLDIAETLNVLETTEHLITTGETTIPVQPQKVRVRPNDDENVNPLAKRPKNATITQTRVRNDNGIPYQYAKPINYENRYYL